MTTETVNRCDFCNLSQAEVKLLISGPKVLICNLCVDICIEIMEAKGLLPEALRWKRVDVFQELNLRPRFRKVEMTRLHNHCFHLCAFSEPFTTIYKDHILVAAQAEGFTCNRADEIFGTQPIIDDIWEALNRASVVLADVTQRNPNVMYEVGMAHTIGKPVIILSQSLDDVPFDLKHYRCILYTYTPRGCAQLEEQVRGTLRFLKARESV